MRQRGFIQNLKEERARRSLEELGKKCARTIDRLNKVSELGNEFYKARGAVMDATGHSPSKNVKKRRK